LNSLTVAYNHQSSTAMQFDSSFGSFILLFDSEWLCFYFPLQQFWSWLLPL